MTMDLDLYCAECGKHMADAKHPHKKFCSTKCKNRYRYRLTGKNPDPVTHHVCRQCGTRFELGRYDTNKWLCSDECRRKRNRESTRNFEERQPKARAVYYQKRKARLIGQAGPVNWRFFHWYPEAPRSCESCGETRVVEVAHKPGHERMGTPRNRQNMRWPDDVYVLCPTCHRLMDWMGYSEQDLKLGVWG